MRGEKAAHAGERLRRGFHHVVAGGAVYVHIEERRSQRGVGIVKDLVA